MSSDNIQHVDYPNDILAIGYVIPADDKENTHMIISQIVLDTLKELKMVYPKPNTKRKQELQLFCKLLSTRKSQSLDKTWFIMAKPCSI
jgi:hypothetical protein